MSVSHFFCMTIKIIYTITIRMRKKYFFSVFHCAFYFLLPKFDNAHFLFFSQFYFMPFLDAKRIFCSTVCFALLERKIFKENNEKTSSTNEKLKQVNIFQIFYFI